VKEKKYAIVDIETTGGMSKRDKITEIGIVLHDGERIIESYETLVYPERGIPHNITRITGITNEMVQDAPKFYEVAKKIVELTEGAVFVAHNVKFDYNFIKHEFEQLGFTYTRKQLCTVKLTRKVFPGLRSYSLGNLIKHFGIEVNSRHRALEDARATAIIFDKIIKDKKGEEDINSFINQGIKATKLPKGITMDLLHNLPEAPGVYYMYNSYKKVVYVGKSIHIKKRVFQHFNSTSRKNERMVQVVNEISYELTGSDLVAMLLESKEIKSLSPELNVAQRTKSYPYFSYCFLDLYGYLNFRVEKFSKKQAKNKQVLNFYGSKVSAVGHLSHYVNEYNLCDQLSGLSPEREDPCFSHQIGKCEGACVRKESPEEYNIRAAEVMDFLKNLFNEDFIIIEKGRNEEEKAVILIEDGHYRGYGFIALEELDMGIEEIKEAINYVDNPNPETNIIVKTYIDKHKPTIISI